jgi:hypothetical protein
MHDEAAEGVEIVFLFTRRFFFDVQHRFQAFDTDIAIDQPRTILALN